MQDFRQIRAWKRAHDHALNVRRATRTYFPHRGFNQLRDQLIRAAESIAETIAEGCGAATRKEFARFLDISIKSSNEVEYGLLLAHDNDALPAIPYQQLTAETIEIRKMICGLRRRLKEADAEARRRRKRPLGKLPSAQTLTDD